jgi:hypothetical protein
MTDSYTVQTDLDLPPILRTEANLWEAMYWKSLAEIVKANKGIHRLQRRVKVLEEALKKERLRL